MVRRTFDLLERYSSHFPQKADALVGKQNGVWIKYSSRQYIETAYFFSYGIMALGLKPGDKIATVSNNRPEWNIADMGMAQAGIIHAPIYPTISADDYTYILRHCEPKMILISDRLLLEKLKPIIAKIPSVEFVYTFNTIEGINSWNEILELGKEKSDLFYEKLNHTKSIIQPDDLVTLIYTSGTTGIPKGVMLSHRNLVSNFTSHAIKHELGQEHRALSFLPLCHIYERSVNYDFQYKGISIYYSESMGTIMENMKEVRPHIMNTVPRLLERIYDGIIGKGKSLPLLQKIFFFRSIALGLEYNITHKNTVWYNFKLLLADKLIFSKWRSVMGGEVRYIICGGAALQIRLGKIFWAAKIKVLEGYGLSETGPVISVNDPSRNMLRIGTVGPVMENIQVKIAADGEILCKGPNIMLGYYKAPDLTAMVIDKDGWFHTGDIGTFEESVFLKITDRKKEIFKLSSGKYISPQVIENKLKESFFIEQIMVVGENEKFASALIVPNFQFLHNWCTKHRVNFQDNNDLITYPEVINRYRREVVKLNQTLGSNRAYQTIQVNCRRMEYANRRTFSHSKA